MMFGNNKNLMMVFDGNYFCYRAYYGYSDLFLKDRKTHVGMIFGFLKQIKSYYKRYRPGKIIITWDSKENKRKEIYPKYKSKGRDNLDFDEQSFFSQLKILKSILKDLGIHQVSSRGYEADDVMSEFSNRILKKRPDMNIYIVTSDHDLYQIINKRISVLKPGKDGAKLYTERVFIDEFNITPKQYLQSMYLSGCNTDCVPGIDGIGEKTAIKIIKKIGDISKLKQLESIKGIGDKRLKEIKCSEDKINFAKSLVTVFNGFNISLEKGEKKLHVVKSMFKDYFGFDSFIYDWDDFLEMCS